MPSLVVRKEEHTGAKVLKHVSEATNTEIWGHKENITKIVFEDIAVVHEDAELVYDISSLQDQSVMAYMINNGDDTYTTYINSDGKITANRDSSLLFLAFINLTTIEGLENLDTSQVTNMSFMFYDCFSLTALDVTHFNTSKVIDMSCMFYGCSGLTALDVSNFNNSEVTDMSGMFMYCTSLTALDLSNFDTSQVTNMSMMFSDCSSLTILNLSGFNTSQVTNMDRIFYNCSELTTLDVSNFATLQLTNMSGMFYGCSGLTTLDFRNADFTSVTEYDDMFAYVPSSISIIVKDQAAKGFIEARLGSGVGTVTIA